MQVKHIVWLSGFIWLARPPVAQAAVEDSTTTVDAPDAQQNTLSEEAETKGVIPTDGETLSTQPVTPTSLFTEKSPYDQAKDEMIHALDLYNKGHYEAASDTALEAYDDLIDLHRVPGVKRSVIREQTRQAAGLYVEAGIAYIQAYVHRTGGTPAAVEEGRARMEDLRDVARLYPELNKKLNNAINQLSAPPVGQSKQK